MTREELQQLLDAHFENALSEKERELLLGGLALHPDLEAEYQLWEDLDGVAVEQPGPGLAMRLAEALETVKREERAARMQQQPSWLERALASFWPSQPAYSFAAAALFLVLGLAGGWLAAGGFRAEDPLLRELRAEVRGTRELVVLTMLQQESATDRLRAVSYSSEMQNANPAVIHALVRTLRFDASVDVRLAAIEVLSRYREQTTVRQAFLDAVQDPASSPLVQVELIVQLSRMQDPQVRTVLEQMAVNEKLDRSVRMAAARQVQATL
jgi:hypothetical protein